MTKKITFVLLSFLMVLVFTGCDGRSSVVIDEKSDEEVKIEFREEDKEKETAIAVIFSENISEKELYTIAKSIDAEVAGYLTSTNAARFILDTKKEDKVEEAMKTVEATGKTKDIFISE